MAEILSTLDKLQQLGLFTGMGDIYMAPITKMETPTEAATYGTPQLIAEGVSFGITPVYAEGKVSASNRTIRKIKTPMGYTLKIEYPRILAAVRSYLLGHRTDAKGGELLGSGVEPPYVAIGYSATRDSGKPMLRWLYKVRFTEQTLEDKTEQEGTLEYRIPVLEGDCVRCDNTIAIQGEDGTTEYVRPLRYDADLESPDCKWTEKEFFAAVPQYTPAGG